MSILGHDTLTHLIEYPAASGRFYHRREDGSVLRVETKLADGSWFDITCDVVSAAIQWGDTTGTDLTPTSDTGQCQLVLRDSDGRYGPIPPIGFPLHQRWRPVRIWLGYVADPAHMPVDADTDFGEPGDYGSTPPALYGGHARSVEQDGIECRFSGWILSQERDPLADVTTTWTLGDGMVRLVDQTIDDYDNLPDPEQPEGMRDGAPGNYRVQTLISKVRGPDGAPYPTVVDAAATRKMMRSPDGKVGDLVRAVATSDLCFFWWRPNVAPLDHDTIADYFEYRNLEWLMTHGLDWLVDCDHLGIIAIDEVSDDSNFYSAVRAAKGIIKRSVPLPQPPWTGAAFDTEFRKVAFAQWKVQPGESYQFRLECSPRVARLSFQTWVRLPGTTLAWTDCGQQSMTDDPTTDSQSVVSKQFVVDATVADDTLLEVLVQGKGQASLSAPGFLAENITLYVVRSAGEGPESIVDDPALADTAEIHEYQRKDLMLRYQTDVATWADWIVNRSGTVRYSLTNVGTQPDVGNPAWSWAMWHGALLGDKVTIDMHDGSDPTVTQWLRGLELRVGEQLTMTLHLEPIPTGLGRHANLRLTTKPQPLPPGSVPFPGGAFLPGYASPPELPDWSVNNYGSALVVTADGSLDWNAGEDFWPLRTDEVPGERWEVKKQQGHPYIYMPGARGPEMRWYSGGPSNDFGSDIYAEQFSTQLACDGYSFYIHPPFYTEYQGQTYEAEVYLEPDMFYWDVYSQRNPGKPLYGGSPYQFHSVESYMEFDADADYNGGYAEAYMWASGQITGSAIVDTFYSRDRTAFFRSNLFTNSFQDPVFTEAEVGVYIEAASEVYGEGYPYPAPDTSAIMDLVVDPHRVTIQNRQGIQGNVDVLAGVQTDVLNKDRAETTQYARQIGRKTVAFSAGVGSVTTQKVMGPDRFAQAVIVGTTVGGPSVVQVNDPDETTLVFTLDTAYDGDLMVSWTVEHALALQPDPTLISVFPYEPSFYISITEDYAAINVIPYAADGHDVHRTVSLAGVPVDLDFIMVDSVTGAVLGTTTTVVSTYGGRVSDWFVPANQYPFGTRVWVHAEFVGQPNTNDILLAWDEGYNPIPTTDVVVYGGFVNNSPFSPGSNLVGIEGPYYYNSGPTVDVLITGENFRTVVAVVADDTGLSYPVSPVIPTQIHWLANRADFSPGVYRTFHLRDTDGSLSTDSFTLIGWDPALQPDVFSAVVDDPASSNGYVLTGTGTCPIIITGQAFASRAGPFNIADSTDTIVGPEATVIDEFHLSWAVGRDWFTDGVSETYHLVLPPIGYPTPTGSFTLHWVDSSPTPPPPLGGATIGLAVGGISMPLEQVQGVSDSWISLQADKLADLGVGWQRGDYPASMTEPSAGMYMWTDADRWVIAALARGIKPLPILYQLPTWMNGSSNDKTPPTSNSTYATWCAQACTHLWGLGVRAVELWNEQNLAGFWNVSSTSDIDFRVRYANMIKTAYPAIKAATPDMVVVLGGVSTADTCFQDTGLPDPPGKGALSTLERYGQLGLYDNCDAVGWHPYLDDDLPCGDSGGWPAWNFDAVANVIGILDHYAPTRHLTIWTTESGAPRSITTAADQANRCQAAFEAYLSGGCLNSVKDRLGPFFWFCVADRTTGDSREDSFGFMDSTLTTKHTIYDQMKTYWTTAWPTMFLAAAQPARRPRPQKLPQPPEHAARGPRSRKPGLPRDPGNGRRAQGMKSLRPDPRRRGQ